MLKLQREYLKQWKNKKVMNKNILILILCLISTTAIIYFELKPIEAVTTTLFIIKTQTGVFTVTSANSTFIMSGIGGDFVQQNSTAIIFNSTRIMSVGNMVKIFYYGSAGQRYFTDQMDIEGSSIADVKNSEPIKGKLSTITITPTTNTLTKPLRLSLYVNGINTTKSIQIPTASLTSITTTINQSFIQGDSLVWVLTTLDNTGNQFIGNTKILITYIG